MIICWLYQKFVSWHLGGESEVPARVQRHVQSCARCRQFYESNLAIARDLSVSAGSAKRPPSPFLHGKIISAIRAQEKAPVETRATPEHSVWGMALGTACVLLLAGMVWMRWPTPPGQNASESGSVPVELPLNVNLPNAAQMNQWSKALDEPLENETLLVINDAKTAINSLKNSFLPDNAEGTMHGRN